MIEEIGQRPCQESQVTRLIITWDLAQPFTIFMYKDAMILVKCMKKSFL